MCTAINMHTSQGEACLGRTMDFSYPLEPELYITPRGYEWNNMPGTHRVQNRYSYLGIGQDISPVIYADGVNEMGFAAAVLYFPGYAAYDPIPDKSKDPSILPVAALELVNFLLGLCPSVSQAASLLRSIRIVGLSDPVTGTVAPLHWILADKGGACMTVEKTQDGLHLMDNPMGVLTNSPGFQWHMTNLRSFLNVTPVQSHEVEWNSVRLTPFGQGTGTVGLPGDYTPPSRFVRAAYLKSHAPVPESREEAVTTGFHILDSVSIPKGAVITERGTDDYTQYTSFIRLNEMEYFFKTYDNSRILTAKLSQDQDYGADIISLGRLARPVSFTSVSEVSPPELPEPGSGA